MRVIFEGRVQGVGFRHTVRQTASRYDVEGYVRNEWDGSVLLVAEGRRPELEDFLRALLNTRLRNGILGRRVYWEAATGGFSGFVIRA